MHKGVAIPGSNTVDLIHDLLRNRKTPDPVGWQQFANHMRAANISMELVGNVTRRLYLQKKRSKRTPQKCKPTTPETTMLEWESLYISYLNAIAESIALDHVSTTGLHFRRSHPRHRRHHRRLVTVTVGTRKLVSSWCRIMERWR